MLPNCRNLFLASSRKTFSSCSCAFRRRGARWESSLPYKCMRSMWESSLALKLSLIATLIPDIIFITSMAKIMLKLRIILRIVIDSLKWWKLIDIERSLMMHTSMRFLLTDGKLLWQKGKFCARMVERGTWCRFCTTAKASISSGASKLQAFMQQLCNRHRMNTQKDHRVGGYPEI